MIDGWCNEMRRQATLLRWVPLWYIGPFVPGFVLLFQAELGESPSVMLLTLLGGGAGGIIAMNRHAANVMEQEANDIERACAFNIN